MTIRLVRRLLVAVPTFVAVTFVCFAVTRMVPGGPVDQALAVQRGVTTGEAGASGVGHDVRVDDETLDRLRKIYGLDRPLPLAYLEWLGRLCRLDLGESHAYASPVSELLARRLPVTLYFGTVGLVLAYAICIPLGVVRVSRRGGWLDSGASFLVFVGYAVPGWVAGTVLLVLLGGGSFLEVFPLGGLVSDGFEKLSMLGKVRDLAGHTVLPALCYALGSFATLTVLMRGALEAQLEEDYVRTARAKGLPERMVVLRHALANALVPIVANLGRSVSAILAGSYLVEKVFDIHGLGLLGYEAIVARDYPVVLGILVVDASLRLVANLASDGLITLIDPRVRRE